jgi:hypothetical protein
MDFALFITNWSKVHFSLGQEDQNFPDTTSFLINAQNLMLEVVGRVLD